MMRPASSKWLCSGSCQQNRSQSHRLNKMKRMGEDLIMILLVIFFAPSITIGMTLCEFPFLIRVLLSWMVVIVIMQQYVTTILNSSLLHTPGQHSYMKTEDTIQTVLATVCSRVCCLSGCVRQYYWVHHDRNSTTYLGLQAHLHIPNLGPQDECGERWNSSTSKEMPEIWWMANSLSCGFPSWHEVCLSSGNCLHCSSGMSCLLLKSCFASMLTPFILMLASLCSVQLR